MLDHAKGREERLELDPGRQLNNKPLNSLGQVKGKVEHIEVARVAVVILRATEERRVNRSEPKARRHAETRHLRQHVP